MDVNTAPGNAVAREDTVPPKVEFRNRTVTDKWWGVIYILSYVAFLSTGFLLVSKSHMRYEREANGGIQISEYFLGDANECCSSSDNVNNDWGVCGIVNPNKDGGRRLQSGNSTLTGDEGIFDVFLLKPEIIVGLTSLALGKHKHCIFRLFNTLRVACTNGVLTSLLLLLLLLLFACISHCLCVGCRPSILRQTHCYLSWTLQDRHRHHGSCFSREHWFESICIRHCSRYGRLCYLGP